jgi:predicted lipoprotein with Yx(FWY)xxD motif
MCAFARQGEGSRRARVGEDMRRITTFTLTIALAALAVAGCGSSSKSSSPGSGGGSSGASSTASSSTASSGATSSGGGGYNYYGKSSGSGSSSASGAATVKASRTRLGTILVGPNGHALYLFEKDKGPASTCTGACAAGWPPLATQGAPKAGSGLKASLLSTSKRPDGTTQVVYAGHPLYYYAGDRSAGQTSGEGSKAFGAEWYVLSPSGKKVEGAGS